MKLQKKLASKILKSGKGRVKITPGKEKEVKEAITKFDVKGLINQGVIKKEQKQGVSRARANKAKKQKQRGRRKGKGSRKGRASARTDPKRTWMNKIRAQRKLLLALRTSEKITRDIYKKLYLKAKGGFFRSVKHIKLYVNENNLIKK